MSQGQTVLPTTGTVSGLTMTQDTNAALKALLTQNSGSSAPTNTLSGTPEVGQLWLDTSVTPNALRQYDGANWIVLGYIDASNHLWSPPIGGGAATIASVNGTTDIWASAASSITISGTNTIAQLASASAVPGTMKVVTASGAFTLTHDATKLILPTALPITVAAGDSFLVYAQTSTNVRIMAYSKADGTSLKISNRVIGELVPFTGSTAPALFVMPVGQTLSRAGYPDLWTFAQAEIAALNPFYNVGNGTTTFGIGDLRGRVVAAPDNMGGSAASRLPGYAQASTGGEAAHTLVSGEVPPTTFGATSGNDSPDHSHQTSTTSAVVGSSTGNGPGTGGTAEPIGAANINTFNTGGASARHQHTVTGAINGGGGSHNNIQPTMALNHILYAAA